jgi:FkbM family methyltransferase
MDEIHRKLTFTGGSLNDELPEQLMSLQYINSSSTVLELGGNIGRNSCVISSILDDSSRLVVLETNEDDAKILAKNRDSNGFKFNIETCAISKNRMFQHGWNCVESEFQPGPEWKEVKTVPWEYITNKYDLKFDTLVADCEGGLFYILYQQEHFIDSFKTIIVENDYLDYNKKLYVDHIYTKHGFKKIYQKEGCIGGRPEWTIPDFYAVWSLNTR